jgi:hypothetical protein
MTLLSTWDAAVSAHQSGKNKIAEDLIKLADMPATSGPSSIC